MTNDNTDQSFIPLSIFTNNTENMAKKVSRDTCPSITYYFAKYHVLLCKVSRDTFFAIFFVSIHYFLNLFETAEYPQR